MRIEKIRFFRNENTNPHSYFYEQITWALKGVSVIQMDDPRCVPIGNPVIHPITGQIDFDMWLPLFIKDPGYEVVLPVFSYRLKTVFDEEGLASTRNVVDSISSCPAPFGLK